MLFHELSEMSSIRDYSEQVELRDNTHSDQTLKQTKVSEPVHENEHEL